MITITTKSATETKKFAASLAKKLKVSGGVVALSGELGAGKTTFTQGFAKGLNIKEKIISPTFVLIRQHQIPHSTQTLYHLDLYRLENNFDQLGLAEIFDKKDNLVLIEWAEKFDKLPKETIKINIEKVDRNVRKITVF